LFSEAQLQGISPNALSVLEQMIAQSSISSQLQMQMAEGMTPVRNASDST
jgi:hypothetical protein